MPGYAFTISRHFAEEMRAPGNHIVAQQVLYTSHNTGVRQDVVNAAMAEVGRANRIAVTAGGQRFRQKVIEVTPDAGNFFFVEDANASQIAVVIEDSDLIPCENRRVLGCRRTK